MKSNPLSKKDTAALLQAVTARWGMDLPMARNLMVYHVADGARLYTGAGIRILEHGGEYLPFLSEAALLERFPRVVVDMGAVKFMCNGANVMRPGIRSHSEFGEGAIVCVAEESRLKFLAVGRAQVASSELGGMERGEVVENLHYVSDRFWDAAKAIRG